MRAEKLCRPIRKTQLTPRVFGEEAPALDLSSGRALCAAIVQMLRFSLVGKARGYVLLLSGDVYAHVHLERERFSVQLSRYYNPDEEGFSRCIVPAYDDCPDSFSSDSELSELDSPRSEMF